MKKNIIFWLIGIVVISVIGILLLNKASTINVPEMMDDNWFELKSQKDKFKLGGIMCLAAGNIFYSGVYLMVFMFKTKFNPKMRAKVTKYMVEAHKEYQKEIDQETYKNMQDVAKWNVGVHEKAMQEVASNFVPDAKSTKEVIKVRCIECGALNEEDAMYCNKCGTKMQK